MESSGSGASELRALCASDLEAVVAIDAATAGVSRRGYFEKRLAAATDRPRDYVYVGLDSGGELAGFAFAKLVEGEFGQPGASAALDAIGVTPAAQGKGVGRRLLGAVEEILVHKGVDRLTTQVDWADRGLMDFLAASGFALDSRTVLARGTDAPAEDTDEDEPPEDAPLEIDHSAPGTGCFTSLARDRLPVRSMTDKDLQHIVKIDQRVAGRDRSAYFARKQHEVLQQSGVRVSLVAELDGYPVGYIMARVDFGEFGHTSEEAVMDTIGVDPGYRGRGVGQALLSQLMANLSVLRVQTVRTEIEWNDVGMIGFLSGTGFAPTQRVSLIRRL